MPAEAIQAAVQSVMSPCTAPLLENALYYVAMFQASWIAWCKSQTVLSPIISDDCVLLLGILRSLSGHAVCAVLPPGEPADCHSSADPAKPAATQCCGPEHAGRRVSCPGHQIHVPAAGRAPAPSQVTSCHMVPLVPCSQVFMTSNAYSRNGRNWDLSNHAIS